MLAYRFIPGEPNPVPQQVPIPTPAAEEVLVKVLAAGVCHTDVGILTPGDMLNLWCASKSFTLGHEGAGIIAEIPASVASAFPNLKVGDYVAMWCGDACKKPACSVCAYGFTDLCTFDRLHGVGLDGTWAEYITLHASCVVPVPASPERIPPAVISAATDATLSPYHAMKTCCGVRPEHTVLCMGTGGLGLNGVAIAKKCLRARCVIACDTRQSAREDALAAGADYAVGPEELAGLVEEKKLVVDFAFDFVGIQATFDSCFAAIRPGGTIHVLGLGANAQQYQQLVAMSKNLTLKTSFWGARSDLAEVLQAIAEGTLQPKVDTRPMSEVVEVLDEMRAGRLQARVALIPEGAASASA
uniref:Alcohol dehydogenase n=1 Tax=Phanerodontia chrysosporium TaxID=2822231 RepID=C9W365_PHACH|nr:alcohol dehydogenase [Phanerodontia chrysosporium]